MASHKKGILIGLGLVVVVGAFVLMRRKSSASNTPSAANPNLVMVSSANTNVAPGGTSYEQSLSQIAAISKQLSTYETNPSLIGRTPNKAA